MSDHKGGCHCGQVRFEAELDTSKAVCCNCSICQKKGSLLVMIDADQFRLQDGEDCLKDYQFNSKTIHHLFCTNCGVSSFARGTSPDGKQMVAVNIRCLDDVDLDAVELLPFNGRDM